MALLRKKKSRQQTEARLEHYKVLRAPIITEKAAVLEGKGGGSTVAFSVLPEATKPEIKEAVQALFGVEVDRVRVCNTVGKLKRTTRASGRTASGKKAYVTLRPGHSIDIVEGL